MPKQTPQQTEPPAENKEITPINSPLPRWRFGLSRNKLLLGAGAVVILAALITSGYFYQQSRESNRQLSEVKSNPQKVSQDETNALIAQVGKLIVLPQGEQPTVATVTDPERLSNQAFFANAKKGDKVLIYTTAKKAILYDPVGNKIVEAAPLNIGNESGTEPQVAGSSTTAKSQVSIRVLNGSRVSGLARQAADKLKQAGYTAVTTSDAPQGAQEQTTVTYGTAFKVSAADVNQVLNGQGILQEQASATGITVILGSDFTIE